MMYSLFTKTGSIITKKNANNLDEAIDMFAKIKGLTRSQFLNIFIVEQSK